MSDFIEWAGCKCKVERGKCDVNRIPVDCAATWKLISSGCTVGVFQLEKKLGQDWARKIKPRNIEELADLISLLRPGCLESGMAEDYATIKAGKKEPLYIHQSLKPILAPTLGCLIYQEQAIRIAVELAGFSLAQGDDLRKGIGKKLPEVIAKLKTQFVEGCVKKGLVTRPQAEEIFGWIEKFQRYGFNKSHAVSYGMVGYQTAWLKCHFPMEFYTAYLTYSAYKGDSTEEVYKLVQDARLFGIGILPPDIRRGNAHFEMTPEGIAFGLAHIRGVGTSAIEKIDKVLGRGKPPEPVKVFVFRDQISKTRYTIPLLECPPIECWESFGYDKINPAIEARELETRYGVHDWEGHGEHEVIGFTSYEVAEDRWDALIEEWREILTGLGFTLGPTEKAVEASETPAGASGGATGQSDAGDAIPCAGSLQNWPQFVRVATELPRNVAEGLVKAGAVDWAGMPRTQMLAELEAILGTSTRNEIGEKVEIRGLTEKEMEFFLAHFGECGSTKATLELMASAGPNEAAKPLSQMSKPELSDLLKTLAPDVVIEKPTVKALKEAIQATGWTPPKKAVANDARREVIAGKAAALAKEFKDTNTANAHAERYFLGISLTCSPADDADNSMATANCLDIARSPNDRAMSAVCIIDQVRHTKTKRGKNPGSPMCFLQISDSTYSLDTVVFPDTYEKVKHLCNEDAIVMVYGFKRDGSFLVQDMKKLL